MKNKRLYDILFALAALFILTGAVLNLSYPQYAPYIYSVGVVFLVISRINSMYKGNDFRLKRLQNMQFIATLLYIPVAYFMFVQNKLWVAILTAAAVMELVTSFRAPSKK
ncbi:MAG: hypothetical protein EOL95_02260 [Bacteroidia bacterium]|nr:hypothetical protein [Bacteroidia bacterium]